MRAAWLVRKVRGAARCLGQHRRLGAAQAKRTAAAATLPAYGTEARIPHAASALFCCCSVEVLLLLRVHTCGKCGVRLMRSAVALRSLSSSGRSNTDLRSKGPCAGRGASQLAHHRRQVCQAVLIDKHFQYWGRRAACGACPAIGWRHVAACSRAAPWRTGGAVQGCSSRVQLQGAQRHRGRQASMPCCSYLSGLIALDAGKRRTSSSTCCARLGGARMQHERHGDACGQLVHDVLGAQQPRDNATKGLYHITQPV